jgi:hypothetical protein
VGDWD